MTTTMTPPLDLDEVLSEVRQLLPAISERALDAEKERRLPADLVSGLRRSGAFGVLLPASHGGCEASLSDALTLFEEVAAADASMGWVTGLASCLWADLTPLPRPTFDEVFAAGPRAMIAGVFSPSGSMERQGESWAVSGRWAFASGCEHADWIYGNCMATDDGQPSMRTAVLAPDQITIEDTWHSTGLRATGSHHFTVDGVSLPEERTCAVGGDERCVDTVASRIPPVSLFAISVAGIAIGIATGARHDIDRVAEERVPLLSAAAVGGDPMFQSAVADADTRISAARALLHDVAGQVWTVTAEGRPLDDELRARVRAAATWSVQQCVAVTTGLQQLGGGGAVYETNPLQRRARDAQALAQHFLVRPDTMAAAGALLLGRPIEVPIF